MIILSCEAYCTGAAWAAPLLDHPNPKYPTPQDAVNKMKGAAGAAVGSAKEGLASAYEGAKGLFAGLSGNKPMDAGGAQPSEL